MPKLVPFYATDIPFDIVYRNNSTSFPVKPHTHNALEIYFTLTDLPDVLLNDTVSSVRRGSLIVIPPHYVHQLFNQKLTVYERYIVTVNSQWLNKIIESAPQLMPYASSSALPLIIQLKNHEIESLRTYLDAFMSNHSEPSISAYADFFSLLQMVDELITAKHSKSSSYSLSISKSQKKVNDVIAYINLHLAEPISLDTIAAEFHLNKDYLGRLFKEHTHATIGHYISVQRVGLAQNLLLDGHTVSEVQEALGFNSYAYFFKFFKKMTGVSPSHFRKYKSDI